MSSAQVHVISKQDITKHTTVTVDPSQLPPLADGSVRMRSSVISISLNNKGYASLGKLLAWWDTYPAPSILPAPYNDQDAWGIVPSWGYGKVIESKDSTIPEGTLLWGFWPTSSLPVDMKFGPPYESNTTTPGAYAWEISEHRKTLMSMYNFYEVIRPDAIPSKEEMAWSSTTLATWKAGWYLGHYGFPLPGHIGINPAGHGEWTDEDTDLSKAVVVNLTASSKTMMGFQWHLTRRHSYENAPLATLEVTSSSPESLPTLKAEFETKKTTYDELSSQATIDWIAGHKPSRLVMINCGAPVDTVRKFQDAVLGSDIPLTKLSYVTLASMPGTAEHPDPRTSVVYMNTSPIIEEACQIMGVDPAIQPCKASFKEWLAQRSMGGQELKEGNKVEGGEGIEGAWEKLMTGALPRNKAQVFYLD